MESVAEQYNANKANWLAVTEHAKILLGELIVGIETKSFAGDVKIFDNVLELVRPNAVALKNSMDSLSKGNERQS